jgi:hypothetical protein
LKKFDSTAAGYYLLAASYSLKLYVINYSEDLPAASSQQLAAVYLGIELSERCNTSNFFILNISNTIIIACRHRHH